MNIFSNEYFNPNRNQIKRNWSNQSFVILIEFQIFENEDSTNCEPTAINGMKGNSCQFLGVDLKLMPPPVHT